VAYYRILLSYRVEYGSTLLTGKVIRDKGYIMTKKTKPVCMQCGSNDALYVTLRNGERLPSYTIKIGVGIVCNECKNKAVA
jgi:hypothetical protein